MPREPDARDESNRRAASILSVPATVRLPRSAAPSAGGRSDRLDAVAPSLVSTIAPSSQPKRSNPPRWMRGWLIAAGAYNLIWGAMVVVAPLWTLTALGVLPALDGATASELALAKAATNMWACVGMIVGVYGIGYLAAARDPLRHWPIILVGLLGKIFGPIGFVLAASRGDLPWTMGWTLLTNDLLWWVPFGLMIARAARTARTAQPIDERS